MEKVEEKPISIEIIHQKVGRNLLLFQKFEYTLKAMVATSEISGYVNDLEGNKERRKSWAMKQTLGQIVGEHVDSINTTDRDEVVPPTTRKEPYLSIRLSTQCEDDIQSNRKSVLAGFVKERNELVHHLFAAYDLNNAVIRCELDRILDDQHQRLRNEVNRTFELGKSQFEARHKFAEWLQSEEGRSFFSNIPHSADQADD